MRSRKVGLMGSFIALVAAGCAEPQVRPSAEVAMHPSEQFGHRIISAIAALPSPVDCETLISTVRDTIIRNGGKLGLKSKSQIIDGVHEVYKLDFGGIVEIAVENILREGTRRRLLSILLTGSEQKKDPSGVLNLVFGKPCTLE